MNFHKLKYVVVAADSGSFREAARRLYMAQSSLSTAIKELEEEYQIQIFERTKRGIYITPEGANSSPMPGTSSPKWMSWRNATWSQRASRFSRCRASTMTLPPRPSPS